MKIGIAGGGAFGTALGVALALDGNTIHLWARDAQRVTQMQSFFNTVIQLFRMCPCGNFRHHAAEFRMQRRLPINDRGQHIAIPHDRRRRIIAAAFNA